MKYDELSLNVNLTGNETIILEIPFKRIVTRRKHWWSRVVEVTETVIYKEIAADKIFYDQINKTVVIRSIREDES